ncbi:zinc finger, CCHC-type containing protein [Tanacetum coccineum]
MVVNSADDGGDKIMVAAVCVLGFRERNKVMVEEDAFLVDNFKGVYVLTTLMPELLEDDTVEAIRRRAKWENNDYICKGHILNEDASSKKFPDFKHTLKHGKDDLSLVQLGSHLRIDESRRAQDSDKSKGKKHGFNENNGSSSSNKKPKLECWKIGHFKRDCRSRNKKIMQMLVVRERGLRTNPKTKVDAIAWWIDSGATTNVCKDCCWFKTYESVEDGYVLYMGDDHFTHVHEKGSVVLEFSLGKSFTLVNVLHVPKLFLDDSSSIYMSSSTVVKSLLWHARLGHVHYRRMLEMSKDDLIPAIDENPKKCTTCMLTKITRQPFKSITRKSVLLELIHSDLCNFHATPSLGIIHETTAPYTPQQNGVVERKNRALKEMDNSMLSYSGLSEGF